MSTPNWRREPRIEKKIPVSIVRGKVLLELETSDISFKGLFLRTASPPPVRSLVRLRVALPSRAIEAHAMAVHIGEAGVGLQFWGLAGPDRNAWDDFVRELTEEIRASKKKLAAAAAATEGLPMDSFPTPTSQPPPAYPRDMQPTPISHPPPPPKTKA